MNQENNNVVFEESMRPRAQYTTGETSSKISDSILKYSGGLIKDKKQATTALIVISIVCFVIAFIVTATSGTRAELKAPPGMKIVNTGDEPPRLVPLNE